MVIAIVASTASTASAAAAATPRVIAVKLCAAVATTAVSGAAFHLLLFCTGEDRFIELYTAENLRFVDMLGLGEFEEKRHAAIVGDFRHFSSSQGVGECGTGDIGGVFADGAGETLGFMWVNGVFLSLVSEW
jgi:hypothetical protein